MGNVLILGSDDVLAHELARGLQSVSCRTTVCCDRQQAIDTLKKQAVDIVVLISGTATDWKTSVEAFRGTLDQLQDPPQIICVLCGPYRGPADRLYGARRGVRVIYENH